MEFLLRISLLFQKQKEGELLKLACETKSFQSFLLGMRFIKHFSPIKLRVNVTLSVPPPLPAAIRRKSPGRNMARNKTAAAAAAAAAQHDPGERRAGVFGDQRDPFLVSRNMFWQGCISITFSIGC